MKLYQHKGFKQLLLFFEQKFFGGFFIETIIISIVILNDLFHALN